MIINNAKMIRYGYSYSAGILILKRIDFMFIKSGIHKAIVNAQIKIIRDVHVIGTWHNCSIKGMNANNTIPVITDNENIITGLSFNLKSSIKPLPDKK